MTNPNVHNGAWNPKRSQAIVTAYRRGKTLAQLGIRYRLSRERVRQILAEWGPEVIRPRGRPRQIGK